MPAFMWNIRHFPTIAALTAYLDTLPRPSWATNIVLHHTWKPTVADWQGDITMRGMGHYYLNVKGWPSGPHFFAAPDGIWQGTPPIVPGTHAGECNAHSIALEVVGNYDNTPWSGLITGYALGTLAALCGWLDLPPSAIVGHRDCGSMKTCPGTAIRLPQVREAVTRLMALPPPIVVPPPPPPPALLTEQTFIMAQQPRARKAQALAYLLKRPGHYDAASLALIIDAYWSVCASVDVDPLIAVAQLAHETGNLNSWWCQRPRRNPAGIGVTGKELEREKRPLGSSWAWDGALWQEGCSFPSWADHAVPAHVGRLLLYALPGRSGSNDQRELMSLALAVRPLAPVLHGSAPTLKELGAAHNRVNSGKPRKDWVAWAVPGDAYGRRIAAIANAILGMNA